MMGTSSSAGLYRQLDNNECLWAAPKSDQQKNGKARRKGGSSVSRPFKFPLISCSVTCEDSSNYNDPLTGDMIMRKRYSHFRCE